MIDATGNAIAMCRGFNLVKAMIELEFPKHAEAEAAHAPDHRQ